MTPERRRVLIGGVATVAAASGALVAWRGLATTRDAAASEAVWGLQLDNPAGGRLALGDFRGRPLLLNFWATWCPPCIGELPLLDRFQHEHATAGRWQVVGVAVDSAAAVNGFLAKRPVAFPVGLAGLAGVDLSRTLGNRDGALPFTVIFDSKGQAVDRRLGAIHPDDLQRWQARVV